MTVADFAQLVQKIHPFWLSQKFQFFFFIFFFGSLRRSEISPATMKFSCAHISHTIDRRCRHENLNGGCCVCLVNKQMCRAKGMRTSVGALFHQCFHATICFFYTHTVQPPRTLYEHKFIHHFPPAPFAFYRFTMSISNQSSDKREAYDDGLQDLGVPGSVQTFLWSQIAPFIRPKLGKLHEAACQVSFIFIFLLELFELAFNSSTFRTFAVLSTRTRPSCKWICNSALIHLNN